LGTARGYHIAKLVYFTGELNEASPSTVSAQAQ
jgi:hypothetical protein